MLIVSIFLIIAAFILVGLCIKSYVSGESNGDVESNEIIKVKASKSKAPLVIIVVILAIVVIAIVAIIITMPSSSSAISLTEFNSIQNGMSYEQVCDVIGGPGELLSDSDLGIDSEYATQVYKWDGNGSVGANANITFQGGVVISKAQFGLE